MDFLVVPWPCHGTIPRWSATATVPGTGTATAASATAATGTATGASAGIKVGKLRLCNIPSSSIIIIPYLCKVIMVTIRYLYQICTTIMIIHDYHYDYLLYIYMIIFPVWHWLLDQLQWITMMNMEANMMRNRISWVKIKICF